MVHNLSLHNSIFTQFLNEIRDENIQKDSMRFRRNMERIGEILDNARKEVYGVLAES